MVITAITWLPGQVSPVHGHHVWCAYGIAEGELTEEQFCESYGKLDPLKSTVYRAGEIADRDLECKTIHGCRTAAAAPSSRCTFTASAPTG